MSNFEFRNIKGEQVCFEKRERDVDGKRQEILYRDGVGYIKNENGELIALGKNKGDTWFTNATYYTIKEDNFKATNEGTATPEEQEAAAKRKSQQNDDVASIRAEAKKQSNIVFRKIKGEDVCFEKRYRDVDGQRQEILYRDSVGYIVNENDELIALGKNKGDNWLKKATYYTEKPTEKQSDVVFRKIKGEDVCFEKRYRDVDGQRQEILYRDGVGYLVNENDELVALGKNKGDTWFTKATYYSKDDEAPKEPTVAEVATEKPDVDVPLAKPTPQEPKTEQPIAETQIPVTDKPATEEPAVKQTTVEPQLINKQQYTKAERDFVYVKGKPTDTPKDNIHFEYEIDNLGRKTSGVANDGTRVEYFYEGDSKKIAYTLNYEPDSKEARRIDYDENGKAIPKPEATGKYNLDEALLGPEVKVKATEMKYHE